MLKKIVNNYIGLFVVLISYQFTLNAQVATITGQVTDSETGKGLPGANVIVEGTDLGAATDEDGNFSIGEVELGSSLIGSMIGYESSLIFADSPEVSISLVASAVQMSGLEVLASRATVNTAVNYTDISKQELELRLGGQELVTSLNTIPSVYATNQGGGSGDARISVRGFNQRNVAIMLNGIPVNDMENGWVYWSNWDGVSDATSSIQMQKGLSAVNLATPSIGGSMNIITDPSSQERKGSFKQEVGAWGFLKTSISYHTGLLMNDKLSLSGTLVKKTGEGYRNTYTDAMAYYFGAMYNVSDKHKLQFYALGAPQRHGQNLYKQNIATYDTEFAKDIDDYNVEALSKFSVEAGHDFNQNVGRISKESKALLGKQHFEMYSVFDVDRHEEDYLYERENFFHKPQVGLNHYWAIKEGMQLSSSLYYSGGAGGGTGTYGSIDRSPAVEGEAWYASSPWTWNWDKTIAFNDTSSTGSKGILRNSNNRQWTIGGLTKFNYDVNENIEAQVGLDLRTAQIYHVKTIRDLLGGSYFVNDDGDFDEVDQAKGLGDAIDYNFTNNVDWAGFFGQAKYTKDLISAHLMAGVTSVKYTHRNHFADASDTSKYSASYHEIKDGSDADWVVGGGNKTELYIEADPITTSQVKGGLMFNLENKLSFLSAVPYFGKLSDQADIWFNVGLVDKAPVFDQVIQDNDSKMSTNPDNEKFTAFELGLNTNSDDGILAAKASLYYTLWSDRIIKRNIQNQDGDDDIAYLKGIDQQHTGIELELAAQVHPLARIDLALGLGKYVYTDDATGTITNYASGETSEEYTYYLKNLLVGDSPQTTLSTMLTLNPISDATVSFNYRYYGKNVSDWSPTSRTSRDDTRSTWVAPNYGILDIHASYKLPLDLPRDIKPTVFVHILNATDAVYIQDATDNSPYNGFGDSHYPSDAEVFFGLPMSFNIGLSASF